MDTNMYALETMVRERMSHLRAEARRLDRLAITRAGRPALRVRLGAGLIGLGEWLRRAPVLVPAGQP
jgi:hypothetical protein